MSAFSYPRPVLGFAAWSGSGKTTLLARLLPLLRARGLRVAMIKHAHHDFDIDQPGKDSHTLRKAGAEQMLIASRRRWALMVESPDEREPELAELLAHLDPARADLVLVEGFKHEHFPKIEVHRAAVGKPLLYPDDPDIIAVVRDTRLDTRLPQLDIDTPDTVAEFVVRHCLAG
ncbi:molybdopterin-guanine dinucleotide biosynthesis protein B [Acidihalobacter prosperus]|uniref:Molybdopterin-guanine dinucleotide biosynthesis protein MobB n=1 Tax=Acidihalobacter prosperus TaxID=160660 RepID=A0A1A6C777_9GAMM|nr:molybdopterin-guanine dinucleotide biosynthesis protein B [Acidihalobacter prosperus]OBS10418.1 molybdopterin-guanine dinucleotide biosynthesis protein MobB [Acidihalobacter prosperus]